VLWPVKQVRKNRKLHTKEIQDLTARLTGDLANFRFPEAVLEETRFPASLLNAKALSEDTLAGDAEIASPWRHVAGSCGMNVQALDRILRAFFTWTSPIDSRIVDGSFSIKFDYPVLTVAVSGAGKSPLQQFLYETLITKNRETFDLHVAGGCKTVEQSSASLPALQKLLPWQGYRSFMLWEELFGLPSCPAFVFYAFCIFLCFLFVIGRCIQFAAVLFGRGLGSLVES
jgi:hypothetical protein